MTECVIRGSLRARGTITFLQCGRGPIALDMSDGLKWEGP
jgi:hypothetical protein